MPIFFRPDQSLQGTIIGAPAAVSWGSGHTSVFARGTTDRLYHRVRLNGEGGEWHPWEDHGGVLRSRPAAASWGPERIDVMYVAEGGRIGQSFFDPHAHGWHDGIDLGLPGSGAADVGPALVSWAAGRLDLFVAGRDGHLWQRFYDAGAWSAWIDLGAPPWGPLRSALSGTSWGPGRIDLFTRGPGDSLWHMYYDSSSRRWFPWEDLGGVLSSDPAPMTRGAGRLDIFASGVQGPLYVKRFFDGVWHEWQHLEIPGSPDLGVIPRTFVPDRFSLFLRHVGDGSLVRREGYEAARPAASKDMQCTFSVDDTGHGAGALKWLVGDVFGSGRAALVQPWQNGGQMAMLVYQGDERGALHLRFRKDDMGQGAGAIGMLIGDIDRDGRDEIVQLWDHGGKLGIIVYGGSSAGTPTLEVQQVVADMGQGSGSIGWLIGDIDADGREEIIHLWNHGGRLAVLGYSTDANGRLMLKLRMDDSGHGARALAFMLADVNGDGRAEIVHVWDGGGLRINVYGWDTGQGMPALSSSGDLGHGAGHVALLVGDVNGDGRAELVQVWDDHDRVGFIVYGFDRASQARVLWSGTHPSEGPGGRWLLGDIDGDGRAELVQVWRGSTGDDDPRLGLNVWTGDANGIVSLAFGRADMSQGPEGLDFLLGDFNGDQRLELLQPWRSRSGLGLNLYKARSNLAPEVADDERLQLLTTYAPRVWLHPDELYMPSSVEWAFPHLARLPYDDGSGYWLQTRTQLKHDSDNSLPLFRGDLATAPAYAFWVDKGDVVDLVYFFYYPYNRGKEVAGTVFGSHVGDWEHVTVRLMRLWDPAGRRCSHVPHQFCVSMHEWQRNMDWSSVTTVGGTSHPVVYAAEGSHGCWTTAGSHVYHDVPRLTDVCAEGHAWDTWQRLVAFDFVRQRGLNGRSWPGWMSNNYPDPGTGDPSVPGNGPIWRWGNKKGGLRVFEMPVLDDGPVGPIEKGVWNPFAFE